MKRYTYHLLALVCLIGVLLQPVIPRAQASTPATISPEPQGPGWRQVTLTDGASPAEARQAAMTRAATLAPQAQVAGLPTTAAEVTPEIEALARALQHDPVLIFDYVHNHIDYVPIYGTLNGATGTLLAGRGTDADQAALFIALMRASGYTANYVTGDVTYPVNTLANWVGTEAAQAGNVFLNGGIPIAGGVGGYQITRIWAEAEISSTTYTFDPALKEYAETAGLADLGSALGYNRTQFLSDAQLGATTTTSYTLNLNEANIRADLITYTMNLIDYIDANLPSGGVADVIGGREIVQTELTAYATTLPGALSTANVSRPINLADYRHTLRIEHEGIDHTFDTFQLADRRVTIFYDEADGNKPVLRVDGTPVATGTTTISGTVYAMTVTVYHPYNGFNQAASFNLKSGGAYALLHDFNTVSAGVIAARNARLTQYRHDGLAESSEAMLGEALSLMGWTWLHEVHLFSELVGHVGDVVPLTHHEVGIMGQEEGYFIDVPMGFVSNVSTDGVSDTWAAFRAQTMMGSAFEHGVIEQLQGTPSASTIKMLTLNNDNGDKTFLAAKDNWNTVKPQLQNYSAGQLTRIEASINQTHTLVLPEYGDITLNAWKGTGYIDDWQNAAGTSGSMGMIISGGYYGGYGTITGTVPIGNVITATTPIPPDRKEDIETPDDKDPVDMSTGAFHNGHIDLALGSSEPFGLNFVRTYNSGSHYALGALGYGWYHNYDLFLHTQSDGRPGLGARGPKDAAALIAYTYAALDLLADDRPIEEWMTTALATKWAMDQLIDNSVTVNTGEMTLTFVRLVDGTYAPPPGMHRDLIKNGGTFYLQDEVNGCFTFNAASGRAQQWQDAYGNNVTFGYDAGVLKQVASSAGITLTLGYNGDGLLANVSDHVGRVVTYTYNVSQELTTYIDAMGHPYTYTYDTAHRLTSITRPEGNTTLTNTYDNLGQMETQSDGTGTTATFYFNGYRNASEDATGAQMAFHVDAQGRFQGQEDALGNRYTVTYDALGRITQVTNRLGETTAFTYDATSGRVATLTNAHGDSITYTYTAQTQTFGPATFTFYRLTRLDYPDGTHESYTYDAGGNLQTQTDRTGEKYQFAYNAQGQLTRITNPAGGESHYRYNADGTLAASWNSDTITTTYQYNAYRQLNRLIHPGGGDIDMVYNLNGQVTRITNEANGEYTYAYDDNGNLVTITDPQSNAITYTRDGADRIVAVADPLNATTVLTYANGRLAAVEDPNGNTLRYGYDERGWLTALTDSADKTWTWDYDDEHTLQSAGTPQGHETTYSYDAAGWLTSITDAAGQAGGTAYDVLGRATMLTDRLNRQIGYAYDDNGALASVTTDAGSASYTRNALGLLEELQDFNTATWEYAYTSMGRLATHTDPVNNQWIYTYDDQGRLAQINYPTGEQLTKTYDAVGHETRWQYSAGPDLQFTYDTLGRMTHANAITLTYNARDEVLNTANAGADFGATYDAGGRLETVSYAGQFTVTYTYDRRNQVTRVEDNLTNSWLTFAYDDDGALSEINRSNGVKTTFTRDANGRVTRILDEKTATVADQQFTLNVEGEVTQVAQTLPLDAAGLLAESSASYTYDAASQLSSTGYDYDERGRLTQAPGHTFTWDGASRLTGIDSDAFTYNGLGNLTSLTSGGATTEYAYNYALALAPIVAEKTGGDFDTFYVWSPGGTLLYGIDTSGSATPFFYHFDRLGSTLFLTDGSGAVSDAYIYDPYGMELGHDGTSAQPFTFIGQYGVRRFTGTLYHMQRRTYDAQTGRFLSRDPVGTHVYDPASLNPYQYAAQDPINLLDPQGEGTWNKDHTVLYTKSGAFVQTEPSSGNYLGGWKYVPGMRQHENPPAPDPDPPTKEEQLEERQPPEEPQENPREAENKAASLSGDNGVQQNAEPSTNQPPTVNAGNTATEMNASSGQTPESDSQHISDLAERAKKVLDTATEGSQAGDLSNLAQFLPGSDMIEMGLNLLDAEKATYAAVAGLQVQKAQADALDSGFKQGTGSRESIWELTHPGLSDTAKKLREHTEKVKDTWHYRWFGF